MTDGSPEGVRPPTPPSEQRLDNRGQSSTRAGWLKHGLSRLGFLHGLSGKTPEQTLQSLAQQSEITQNASSETTIPEPTSTTNSEARTRLVDTIDRPTVVEAFGTEANEIVAEILAVRDYVRTHGPEHFRQQILANFETFLTTFTDQAGHPNQHAIENLANTLVSKIDIISINELLSTARSVVDSSDSNEIVLFVPSEEAREADFNSSRSSNSNEFMAKLVTKYAEQKGKHVVLVTQYQDLGKYNRIAVVDDAIYSGSQLSSRFTEIARNIRHNTQVQLYCARSTDAGLEQVRKATSTNHNLRFEPHVGRKLLNLQEALADNPETYNFFFTAGLTPTLEHLDERPSLREAVEYAESYVKGTTLTISETKTPDFLSFPSRLAKGMVRATEHNDYPSIDTLTFE